MNGIEQDLIRAVGAGLDAAMDFSESIKALTEQLAVLNKSLSGSLTAGQGTSPIYVRMRAFELADGPTEERIESARKIEKYIIGAIQ